MNTKTTTDTTSALLKKATAKLESAKSELAAAKTKFAKWSTAVESLTIQEQKNHLAALGVSDSATFAALIDAAKRGGFKSPVSASAPSPVPVKPSAPVSTSPAR